MAFKGVNHLALVTNDLNKTVRFYRDLLGMPLLGTLAGEAAGQPFRHYFFGMGSNGLIAFFEWPDVELPARKDAGVPASGRHFDHVSITVESEEELLGLQARIRAAGVSTSDVVDHGIIHSLYFEDPNGISLEFSVWVQAYDERPVYADPNPVAAVLEPVA